MLSFIQGHSVTNMEELFLFSGEKNPWLNQKELGSVLVIKHRLPQTFLAQPRVKKRKKKKHYFKVLYWQRVAAVQKTQDKENL